MRPYNALHRLVRALAWYGVRIKCIVTKDDLQAGKKYDDAIAVIPRFDALGDSDHVQIPYRCLVPTRVDGLLVAGRSFSSDMEGNNMVNLILHCIAMGQAAGTAAALSVKDGVNVRDVNIRTLQDSLTRQNVPLPGVYSAPQKV